METQVNPIPQGYHSLTPYLVVKDTNEALEFYKKAFKAKENFRTIAPNGEIGHCEMQIGNSRFMFSGHFGDMDETTPTPSSSLLIYVEEVDEFFAQAVKAGAEEVRPVEDQFYGDRMGTLKDPNGHIWHIATHIEDVSEREMQKRADERWSMV